MATKSQRLLIPSAGLASDTADPSSVHSAFQRLPNANPVGEMIRIQVHTLHKVASNPQSDGTAGKEAAQRRENLTSKFFFFFPNSVVCGETKRKRKSRHRRFSKSDFSGKQRKHLSEQSAERARRGFRQFTPWQGPAITSPDLIFRDTACIVF